MAFDRNAVSPQAAASWVYMAVLWTVIIGVITAFFGLRGELATGKLAVIDATVSFGLAYAIWRRSVAWTWVALGYYLAQRTFEYFHSGDVPGMRAFIIVMTYSMAIISMRLYPRSSDSQSPSHHGPAVEGTSASSGGLSNHGSQPTGGAPLDRSVGP